MANKQSDLLQNFFLISSDEDSEENTPIKNVTTPFRMSPNTMPIIQEGANQQSDRDETIGTNIRKHSSSSNRTVTNNQSDAHQTVRTKIPNDSPVPTTYNGHDH